VLQVFEDARQDRDEDDQQDHRCEVVLDDGQVAEEVAGRHQKPDPEQGADDAEAEEAAVGQPADAADEGHEGAHHGHEAGDDDGLGSVLFHEGMGAIQVFPLQEAAALEPEHPGAQEAADPVIDVVAAQGRHDQGARQDHRVHAARRRHRARHEQQGIAGQEGRDDEPGLHEDDGEQDGVDPDAIALHQQGQMLVQMQDDVDELGQQFHKISAESSSGRPCPPSSPAPTACPGHPGRSRRGRPRGFSRWPR
jgi:hypothetical protein